MRVSFALFDQRKSSIRGDFCKTVEPRHGGADYDDRNLYVKDDGLSLDVKSWNIDKEQRGNAWIADTVNISFGLQERSKRHMFL